ncbi:class I SAM-dependent methyltransferase [Promicromonospora sp. NPDC050249]|uniref:class I SAM-dependent methyltransferase n=1 Tax=Promicromonospora sp. NPDC050249 TaxID=3154743 RepID=UPI0033E31FFA
MLDVGCGNGRNGAWLAERGADVVGVDLAAPLLDAVYDSGCFHHLAPHRRITYRERILLLLAPGGRYAVVAFAQENQPSPPDREVLTSGDLGGGMSFLVEDLERIFAPLRPVEVRRVRDDVPGTFGADFLNAGLFEA